MALTHNQTIELLERMISKKKNTVNNLYYIRRNKDRVKESYGSYQSIDLQIRETTGSYLGLMEFLERFHSEETDLFKEIEIL
jgi:hypothetical protein